MVEEVEEVGVVLLVVAVLVVVGVEVPVMTGVPVSMYLVFGSRMSVQPIAGTSRSGNQGCIVRLHGGAAGRVGVV